MASPLDDLINGPAPTRGRSPQPILPPQAATGLDQLVAKIENIQSPVGQEFARGYIRSHFGIDVPTREELELQRATMAQRAQRLYDDQRNFMVRTVVGFLVDNAEKPADEAFLELSSKIGYMPQGQIGSNISLQDFMRANGLPGGLDIGLLERPEELRQASRALSGVFGAPQLELRTEDLLQFPLTQAAAKETPSARAAKETQEQAQTLRAAEDVLKRTQAAIQGEGEFGKAEEEAFLSAEQSHERRFGASVDLDPTAFDDLADLGGAEAFFEGAQNLLGTYASLGLDESASAAVLLQTERGQRVGEILGDGVEVAEVGKDRRGQPIMAAVPKDEVASAYLDFVDDLSTRSGLTVSRIFQLLGLGELGVSAVAPQGGLRASVEAGEAP